MALREFTDRAGVAWKAWDITPDQLHPATRAEDYLQGYLDGWLVFETLDGSEKRRLYPVPARWMELSDAELDGLRARAESVRGERGARPAMPSWSHPAETEERPATRTFLYPGGRVWTVAEQYVQLRDGSGSPVDARTVLRFTSGVRSLDLLAWPPDWGRYSDEELTELLWRAFPRDRAMPNATPHHRRRSDRRADAAN